MRTRPGSIIVKCHDGLPKAHITQFREAWIGTSHRKVSTIEGSLATDTFGNKIRSWIVVKE